MLPLIFSLTVATSTINYCAQAPTITDFTIKTELEAELYKTTLCYAQHAANLEVKLAEKTKVVDTVETPIVTTDSDGTLETVLVTLGIAGALILGFGVGFAVGHGQ